MAQQQRLPSPLPPNLTLLPLLSKTNKLDTSKWLLSSRLDQLMPHIPSSPMECHHNLSCMMSIAIKPQLMLTLLPIPISKLLLVHTSKHIVLSISKLLQLLINPKLLNLQTLPINRCPRLPANQPIALPTLLPPWCPTKPNLLVPMLLPVSPSPQGLNLLQVAAL